MHKHSFFYFFLIIVFAVGNTSKSATPVAGQADYNGVMENDFKGWVRVDGNKFLDPQGDPIIFAGLCASDLDRLIRANQWNERYFGEIAKWGANIIRLPVHPELLRQRGWDEYFKLLDRGIELARQHNLYVIMDWHSIGNLKDELFQPDPPLYKTTLDETFKFWATVAQRYKDEPIVAMYELFNEPVANRERFGECTWEEWREINEQIIDTIRFYNPNALCLVTGFDWAYDLRPVLNDPVRRANVAYTSHPYPPKAQKPWEGNWERVWGHVADKYPIVCTELGFRPEQDLLYGPEITAYFEKREISFTVWCFDISWMPTLISDWLYTPTVSGRFFRDYLQGRASAIPVIVITTQPAITTNVIAGNIFDVLTVSAIVTRDATLSYQWYSAATNSNMGGTAILGETNSTFEIPTTLAASGSPYYYFCEVSATEGAKSIRSNMAMVNVFNPTPITTEDIPGFFTPNGDGINDTWDIPKINEQYPEAKIAIYNRAKKLIVELRGAQMPWNGCDSNGNLLESGYYFYQIEVDRGNVKPVTGYVTIMR